MAEQGSMKELRDLYESGLNIMRLFRATNSSSMNSIDSIMKSYDLQSGSYTSKLKDPTYAEYVHNYSRAIAELIEPLGYASILEAGVGEATTLANVISKMATPPPQVYGFDLSWSRLKYARQYAATVGVRPILFTANLAGIPLADDSIDVVYTSHSIEPNQGRERAILSELHRIANRCLVLLEPSNELGNEATRKRMAEQGYCMDLHKHSIDLGFNVTKFQLFEHCRNTNNQTAIIVIEKCSPRELPKNPFACPTCMSPLIFDKGNHYCPQCMLIFPVVDGIACLLASNGILGSKYLEDAEIIQ